MLADQICLANGYYLPPLNRTLKWMIYVSVPVVGVLYILTNICFFAVLSYDQISNTEAVGLVRRVSEGEGKEGGRGREGGEGRE